MNVNLVYPQLKLKNGLVENGATYVLRQSYVWKKYKLFSLMM